MSKSLDELKWEWLLTDVGREMNEYFDYEVLPKLDEIANRVMETQVCFTQLQLNSEGI